MYLLDAILKIAMVTELTWFWDQTTIAHTLQFIMVYTTTSHIIKLCYSKEIIMQKAFFFQYFFCIFALNLTLTLQLEPYLNVSLKSLNIYYKSEYVWCIKMQIWSVQQII